MEDKEVEEEDDRDEFYFKLGYANFQEENFEDAEAVVIEGEAGDKFYLIKEGTVVCTKK